MTQNTKDAGVSLTDESILAIEKQVAYLAKSRDDLTIKTVRECIEAHIALAPTAEQAEGVRAGDVQERALDIVSEVLDAKEVMRKRGCKQASFAEMFAEFAARSGDDAATPVRFFVYDHEGGYNEFKTDAERSAGHQAAIDAYLDTGCDGWSEEVTQVVSGIVTHKTVQADLQHKPAPCAAHPDHDDESCDECAEWNEWPNHDFETCCRYEPAALAATAPSTGERA